MPTSLEDLQKSWIQLKEEQDAFEAQFYASEKRVLELSSDCKRFLEGPTMYWKQEKGSNWPASENSVFTFLQVFWNFVWPFLVSLGREFDWRGLHMYVSRDLSQH